MVVVQLERTKFEELHGSSSRAGLNTTNSNHDAETQEHTRLEKQSRARNHRQLSETPRKVSQRSKPMNSTPSWQEEDINSQAGHAKTSHMLNYKSPSMIMKQHARRRDVFVKENTPPTAATPLSNVPALLTSVTPASWTSPQPANSALSEKQHAAFSAQEGVDGLNRMALCEPGSAHKTRPPPDLTPVSVPSFHVSSDSSLSRSRGAAVGDSDEYSNQSRQEKGKNAINFDSGLGGIPDSSCHPAELPQSPRNNSVSQLKFDMSTAALSPITESAGSGEGSPMPTETVLSHRPSSCIDSPSHASFLNTYQINDSASKAEKHRALLCLADQDQNSSIEKSTSPCTGNDFSNLVDMLREKRRFTTGRKKLWSPQHRPAGVRTQFWVPKAQKFIMKKALHNWKLVISPAEVVQDFQHSHVWTSAILRKQNLQVISHRRKWETHRRAGVFFHWRSETAARMHWKAIMIAYEPMCLRKRLLQLHRTTQAKKRFLTLLQKLDCNMQHNTCKLFAIHWREVTKSSRLDLLSLAKQSIGVSIEQMGDVSNHVEAPSIQPFIPVPISSLKEPSAQERSDALRQQETQQYDQKSAGLSVSQAQDRSNCCRPSPRVYIKVLPGRQFTPRNVDEKHVQPSSSETPAQSRTTRSNSSSMRETPAEIIDVSEQSLPNNQSVRQKSLNSSNAPQEIAVPSTRNVHPRRMASHREVHDHLMSPNKYSPRVSAAKPLNTRIPFQTTRIPASNAMYHPAASKVVNLDHPRSAVMRNVQAFPMFQRTGQAIAQPNHNSAAPTTRMMLSSGIYNDESPDWPRPFPVHEPMTSHVVPVPWPHMRPAVVRTTNSSQAQPNLRTFSNLSVEVPSYEPRSFEFRCVSSNAPTPRLHTTPRENIKRSQDRVTPRQDELSTDMHGQDWNTAGTSSVLRQQGDSPMPLVLEVDADGDEIIVC